MTSLRSSLSHPAITALTLVLAFACQESPVNDLGHTTSDLAQEEPNEPEPPAATALPPVAEFATEFAGVWIGEAEDPLALQSNADDEPPAYRFPSGSTLIRLELTDIGSPYPVGAITFGIGTPPAPATDPDVGYPTVDPNFDITSPFATGRTVTPTEGFAHRVGGGFKQVDLEAQGLTSQTEEQFSLDGRVLDGKLELYYSTTQVFESWCALQTSDTCPENEGWLVDDSGACFFGDEQVPIDCQKLALCSDRVCYCEVLNGREYCTATPERDSMLTLRLSDEGLVGVFTDAEFVNARGFLQPVGTVHFRPAAP